MKIGVTGASGFIGGYVTRALVNAGHAPVLLLRPSSVLPKEMESLNCVHHEIGDDPSGIYQALGSPDVLIHLAWGGLPNYKSLLHVTKELFIQFDFLRNMIEAGLPKLVVSGTCFEYGMQSGPLTENTTVKPDNPYGFAKATLFSMLEILNRDKPFDLTWTRLFYLFGEGQAKSSLFSQIHRVATTGETIFPMSGGEQLRDFMPVEKFCEDFVSLALTPGSHGAVNICSGHPVSVRSLVEKWIADNNWNLSLKLGHYPYPDYEPMAFWGVRNKLDTILENA